MPTKKKAPVKSIKDLPKKVAELTNEQEMIRLVKAMALGIDRIERRVERIYMDMPALEKPKRQDRSAIVLQVLASGKPMHTYHIWEKYVEITKEDVKEATLGSYIVNMEKKGEIVRVRQGLYQLPEA